MIYSSCRALPQQRRTCRCCGTPHSPRRWSPATPRHAPPCHGGAQPPGWPTRCTAICPPSSLAKSGQHRMLRVNAAMTAIGLTLQGTSEHGSMRASCCMTRAAYQAQLGRSAHGGQQPALHLRCGPRAAPKLISAAIQPVDARVDLVLEAWLLQGMTWADEALWCLHLADSGAVKLEACERRTPSFPSFSIVVSTPSRVNFWRPPSVSCHAS